MTLLSKLDILISNVKGARFECFYPTYAGVAQRMGILVLNLLRFSYYLLNDRDRQKPEHYSAFKKLEYYGRQKCIG